jgi:hypothetical protein
VKIPLPLLLSALSLLAAAAPAQSHTAQTVPVILLSDIHLDPFHDPAKLSQLRSAPVTGWAAILNAPPSPHQADDFAKLQSTCGAKGIDTPPAVLESSLHAELKQQPSPLFVTVSGDLMTHHFDCRFHNVQHYRSRLHRLRRKDRRLRRPSAAPDLSPRSHLLRPRQQRLRLHGLSRRPQQRLPPRRCTELRSRRPKPRQPRSHPSRVPSVRRLQHPASPSIRPHPPDRPSGHLRIRPLHQLLWQRRGPWNQLRLHLRPVAGRMAPHPAHRGPRRP